MMKRVKFIVIIAILLFVIFITQLKLINRPVQDNDEGIYLTTFLLVNSGHPAYKETFLSQPPAFLLTVYPGFIAFGKTLQAARLTIGLWSLIGLLAIVWIYFELKIPLASFLAISLLYINKQYFNQTLILQSDILISVFCLLSLAAIMRFGRVNHLRWLIFSSFFWNLAFWTKFDISIIPSFLLLLFSMYKDRKLSLSKILILVFAFILVSVIFFLIFINPFGWRYIFEDTVKLRFQAWQYTQQSNLQLFNYLKQNPILSLIISASILFSLIKKRLFQFPYLIIFVWAVFGFLLLLFYKPLFPHHLVVASIPFALFLSNPLYIWLKSKIKSQFFVPLLLVITFICQIYYLYIAIKTPVGILNNKQQQVVAIIKKNTRPGDVIVSDEAIFYGASGRLPPPQLVDISYVRIQSHNLTASEFKQIIALNKPKLIISWNGRLQSIDNFNEITKDYEQFFRLDNSKIIYSIK